MLGALGQSCRLMKFYKPVKFDCFSESECKDRCEVYDETVCNAKQEEKCQIVPKQKCSTFPEKSCERFNKKICDTYYEQKCQTGNSVKATELIYTVSVTLLSASSK